MKVTFVHGSERDKLATWDMDHIPTEGDQVVLASDSGDVTWIVAFDEPRVFKGQHHVEILLAQD